MNLWQDIILSTGSVIFALALIPSIISKDKPAIGTIILTAIVLSVFVITYVSMSMWFTAASTSFSVLMWTILGFQQLKKTLSK
jgi:threonine/homoserine/homoserine lactone efflux protein